MTIILEYKEKLKKFYESNGMYVNAAMRFVMALVVFFSVNNMLGGKGKLGSAVVQLGLSAVCAFLPMNFMLLLASAMILLFSFSLSLEITAFFGALFVIMFLLYFRFTPKYAFVVLLTPIAFALKIPYVIPLCLGLLTTPVTVIPMSIGIFVYNALSFIKQNTTAISGTGESQSISYTITEILKNQTTFILIIAFVATVCLVYMVRRMALDHSWSIAIAVGALCEFLVLLVGKIALHTSYGILGLILGTIVSIGLAFLIKFFAFNVDYTRTEKIQFEDDEYYYYVKAVPKVTISGREKTVKKIHTKTETLTQETVADVRSKTSGIPLSELEEIDLDKF